LPAGLLADVLAGARAIGDEANRSPVLARLGPRLANLPWPDLWDLWTQTLPMLAGRTRPDLVADYCGLTPVLVALAGANAETELLEIARAISDVARWWP
jgi:hypothetical protein